MSAYGQIKRATQDGCILRTRVWHTRAKAEENNWLYTYHLTLSEAQHRDGLVEYLHSVFSKVLEDGLTYPQEGHMDLSSFRDYYFAADVIVAITGPSPSAAEQEGMEVDSDLDGVRCGRSWEECVGGFYYIKPNYPGRSSHICNAGFVVPPVHQEKGYGTVLAKTYLEYAPRLGYQASVFNLVYANNDASVKLWERLNFTKAGLIPRAGRLKRKDGDGEEYVDAIVFYKSFLELDSKFDQ